MKRTPELTRCNSTYRLRYWNYSNLNERSLKLAFSCNSTYRLRYWNFHDILFYCFAESWLQQYLPLAVLKLSKYSNGLHWIWKLQQYLPLAVLKRLYLNNNGFGASVIVATVLTACGIETFTKETRLGLDLLLLQQYLPLAVLKQPKDAECNWVFRLQQYLPLAVLKRRLLLRLQGFQEHSCNSTYRLRYWNWRCTMLFNPPQRFVATVLTACGIETS